MKKSDLTDEERRKLEGAERQLRVAQNLVDQAFTKTIWAKEEYRKAAIELAAVSKAIRDRKRSEER